MTITSARRIFTHSAILIIVAVALNACEQAAQHSASTSGTAAESSGVALMSGSGAGALQSLAGSQWPTYRIRDRFEAFDDNQVFVHEQFAVQATPIRDTIT